MAPTFARVSNGKMSTMAQDARDPRSSTTADAPSATQALPSEQTNNVCPACGGKKTRDCPFCEAIGCTMCNKGQTKCIDCDGTGDSTPGPGKVFR